MEDIEVLKKCKDCKEEKALSDFYYRKENGEYRSNCKSCVKSQVKNNSVLNPDKIKERGKIFRQKNKERLSLINKEWRKANPNHRKEYVKNNPEIIKAVAKRAYLKNKEVINIKKKEWYQKNKERHADNRTKYELANKDRLRAARRKWENNRLATDINYKLHKNISGRIREELNGKKKRTERTEMLLGCTIEELKIFLQDQFQDGMTWDNWETNGWHVDHRIPLSWFNLENENCRKLAFSYKNLQPLWGEDNLRKKNFYADKLAS